jgi:hypothetical protein
MWEREIRESRVRSLFIMGDDMEAWICVKYVQVINSTDLFVFF